MLFSYRPNNTVPSYSYNSGDDDSCTYEDDDFFEYTCPKLSCKKSVEPYYGTSVPSDDSNEVAELESFLAIAHKFGPSFKNEILEKQARLNELVLKLQVPSVSKLLTLVLPIYRAHLATIPASAYSCIIEEEKEPEPDCYESSEEETDWLRDPKSYLELIITLTKDKVFGVRYLGTTFEFPTWPEALSFAAARNLPEPILVTSCKLLGGVRKKPRRGNRTKARKRRTTMPLIQSKQLGQINRFVPYDKPVTTTLRFNAVLQTDGSGTLTARLSLRNPLRAFNGSSAYVNAQDYATLYDQYKVKRFSFQFEPSTTGPLRGALVAAFDYDSPDTATPNYANIVNYGGYRIFNVGQQFEIATRVPNITSAFDFTTDPPSAIVVHQGGWIDAATPAAPGNLFLGGVNLGNSVTLGSFVATLLVAWRFRR